MIGVEPKTLQDGPRALVLDPHVGLPDDNEMHSGMIWWLLFVL